jgi:hypothetical protein
MGLNHVDVVLCSVNSACLGGIMNSVSLHFLGWCEGSEE